MKTTAEMAQLDLLKLKRRVAWENGASLGKYTTAILLSFRFSINKNLLVFCSLGTLRPAFCFSFSRFLLHILYAIGSGDTGEDMHQIHKLKDMPSDVGDTSLVEMAHLEAAFHAANEAFDFSA